MDSACKHNDFRLTLIENEAPSLLTIIASQLTLFANCDAYLASSQSGVCAAAYCPCTLSTSDIRLRLGPTLLRGLIGEVRAGAVYVAAFRLHASLFLSLPVGRSCVRGT